MKRHSVELVEKIRNLRREGNTYGEINNKLRIHLAKSTLHWTCRDVHLPPEYINRVSELNIRNLGIARATSLAVRQVRRQKLLALARKNNLPIARKILDKRIAKIALSMLCLGEASKSKRSAFSLGNSDHRVISLFLDLLKISFNDFDPRRIRCTVQCRADQNIQELEKYWMKIVEIPKSQFYHTRIDPRTIGKPTKKVGYNGVLKVDYLNKRTQVELESLADLVYNYIHNRALSSFG